MTQTDDFSFCGSVVSVTEEVYCCGMNLRRWTDSPSLLWATQSISSLCTLHPSGSSAEDLPIRSALLLLHAADHIHRYVDRVACTAVAAQY